MSDELVTQLSGADTGQVQEGAELSATLPVESGEPPITRADLNRFMEDMRSSNEQLIRSVQSQRDMTVDQVRKAVDEHMSRVEAVLSRPEFPPELREKIRSEEETKAKEEAWRSVIQSGGDTGTGKAGQQSGSGAPQGGTNLIQMVNNRAYQIVQKAGFDPSKFDWSKTNTTASDPFDFLDSVEKVVAEIAPNEEGETSPEARIVGGGSGSSPAPDRIAKLTTELTKRMAKDPMDPEIPKLNKELTSLIKK